MFDIDHATFQLNISEKATGQAPVPEPQPEASCTVSLVVWPGKTQSLMPVSRLFCECLESHSFFTFVTLALGAQRN